MQPKTENECRIGVTGHRVLAEPGRLRKGINQALTRIEQAFPGCRLTLYTALAEGADQLVAEAVLDRPDGRVIAVLPLPALEYKQSFLTPTGLSEFERLLARCAEVDTLAPASTPDRAYEAAGFVILDRCDVLLAIWDGQDVQGRGGTGDVVAACRAQGKPLVIVRAGNRNPDTNEPTTLGNAQGQIITERLPDRRQ